MKSFFRLSILNAKMKINPKHEQVNEYASMLFGEGNLLKNQTNEIAPNPLVLFCTDTNDEMLIGDKIAGFANAIFCNKTEHVQTDVGVCVSSDPVMYLQDGEVMILPSGDKMQEDLRNAEHLIVVSVDKFQNPDDFAVLIKNMKTFIIIGSL